MIAKRPLHAITKPLQFHNVLAECRDGTIPPGQHERGQRVMFIPIWAIIIAALVFAFLIGRLMARDAPSRADPTQTDRSRTGQAPPTPRNPEQARRITDALADPQTRALIQNGEKIAAIKRVREATGLGLKEAKEAVERSEFGLQLN